LRQHRDPGTGPAPNGPVIGGGQSGDQT
jgi:hypothetical protein